MKTANRFHTYKNDAKAERTDNGFLRVPVFATRAGIFNYRLPDGTVRRELRHPDDVFKADSMDTLRSVPFTNRHPSELVDAKNVKQFMVGVVSDKVTREDVYIAADAIIMDEQAIKDVEKGGIREVSCGYKCDVLDEPGEWNGQPYDARQSNIRYNHLAMVPRGRAGRSVRLRIDSEDAELVRDGEPPIDRDSKPNGGRTMTKVRVDGVEYEASETLAAAITRSLEKRDSDLATAKSKLESAKADSKKEIDEVQAKYDQASEELKKVRKDTENAPSIKELTKARVNLVLSAKPHLDDDTVAKLDDMDDRDIKIAVIKATSEKFDAEGKSDDYVTARFDAIIEASPKDNKTAPLTTAIADKAKADADNAGTIKTYEDTRNDHMEQSRKAHMQPLSVSVRQAGG